MEQYENQTILNQTTLNIVMLSETGLARRASPVQSKHPYSRTLARRIGILRLVGLARAQAQIRSE